MAPETRSTTKSIIVVIAVLLVTAVLAYVLHFRPAAETVPAPEDVGPRPEEVTVTPGVRPVDVGDNGQEPGSGLASAIRIHRGTGFLEGGAGARGDGAAVGWQAGVPEPFDGGGRPRRQGERPVV